MQKLLAALALVVGLILAYIDSLPTWDDSGILAGAVLLACGLLAVLGFRRPWLLALAVGGWIPLRGILLDRNFGSILALLIGFLGAYLGWVLRLGFRRAFPMD